jgi:hypothetical protein
MSPVGGIGINLAIQDAVAAANILAPYLAPYLAPAASIGGRSSNARGGFLDTNAYVSEMTLAAVQHRRELPTRITQAFQVFAHKQLSRTLGNPAPVTPPWILRFLSKRPLFRRLTARFLAVGVRPEHIDTTQLADVPSPPHTEHTGVSPH